jgi:hypothetical protein
LIANPQQLHVSAGKAVSTGPDVSENVKKKIIRIAGPGVHIPSSTVPVFCQTQAGGGKSHVLLVSHEKGYEGGGERTGEIKQVQKRLCCKVLPCSAVVFRMLVTLWLFAVLFSYEGHMFSRL